MSELARTILRAVEAAPTAEAAEHAIDRLLDADASARHTLLTEALGNARADVSHVMAQLARVVAGRDALAAEVLALTRDLIRHDPA